MKAKLESKEVEFGALKLGTSFIYRASIYTKRGERAAEGHTSKELYHFAPHEIVRVPVLHAFEPAAK